MKLVCLRWYHLFHPEQRIQRASVVDAGAAQPRLDVVIHNSTILGNATEPFFWVPVYTVWIVITAVPGLKGSIHDWRPLRSLKDKWQNLRGL